MIELLMIKFVFIGILNNHTEIVEFNYTMHLSSNRIHRLHMYLHWLHAHIGRQKRAKGTHVYGIKLESLNSAYTLFFQKRQKKLCESNF